MDTLGIILVALIILVIGITLTYYFIKFRFAERFKEWQESQRFEWEKEKEKARKEAVIQSRAVLGGKFVEQMAPYLPEFKYDPTEARFIGSPIDLIVFPGLSSGDPQEIVIIEVKTGKEGQLTPQERKIRQLIEDGMVRWELIQKTTEEGKYPNQA